MVRTVRPKASDTPSRPMPTSGKAAASTALPQPPSTSQNVPSSSAESLATNVSLHAVVQRVPSSTAGPGGAAADVMAVVFLLAALERDEHGLRPDDVHLVA